MKKLNSIIYSGVLTILLSAPTTNAADIIYKVSINRTKVCADQSYGTEKLNAFAMVTPTDIFIGGDPNTVVNNNSLDMTVLHSHKIDSTKTVYGGFWVDMNDPREVHFASAMITVTQKLKQKATLTGNFTVNDTFDSSNNSFCFGSGTITGTQK